MAVSTTLLAVAVGGCVSMPGSGPAVKYQGQVSTGQGQVYQLPRPEPAQPGWGPADVVKGFLEASASYAIDKSTAQTYLTSAASQAWKPSDEAVTVFTELNVSPATDGRKPGAGQAKMVVSGKQVATLTSEGAVVAAVHHAERLPAVDGQSA